MMLSHPLSRPGTSFISLHSHMGPFHKWYIHCICFHAKCFRRCHRFNSFASVSDPKERSGISSPIGLPSGRRSFPIKPSWSSSRGDPPKPSLSYSRSRRSNKSVNVPWVCQLVARWPYTRYVPPYISPYRFRVGVCKLQTPSICIAAARYPMWGVPCNCSLLARHSPVYQWQWLAIQGSY